MGMRALSQGYFIPYLPQSLIVILVFSNPRPLKSVGKSRTRLDLPSVKSNQVREYLNKLDMCKAMAQVGYVLRELTDIERPLLIKSLRGHCDWEEFLKTGIKQA